MGSSKWREKFYDERDRRYSEKDIEREKALRIKDEADRKALELARDIQTYKDLQANQLREQINSERGLYVTHAEIKPITDFVISLQGGSKATDKLIGTIIAVAGLALAAIVAIITQL